MKMEQWEIDAEEDAKMSRFLREIEEEVQREERELNLTYLIKCKWGIDDFEDRGRGKR